MVDLNVQISELAGIGSVYSKQRDALAARKAQCLTRIFSFETLHSTPGSRQYLVAQLEDFWAWYINATRRHMYEVIPEDTPCRLYFDLEFYRECNSGVDELVKLREFCDACLEELNERFVLPPMDIDKNFHILGSSNAEKFSAHVIVHFPDGSLLPNGEAAKHFVEQLTERLLESKRALVHNRTFEAVPLCDVAVYSKNRCFRLYMSSKAGKTSRLQLAKYCHFYDDDAVSKKQVFLDSLVIPDDVHERSSVVYRASVSSLRGSRYCFNIGREHRSNHVYWVVNIKTFKCFQKCFDPDCAGFRSFEFGLPFYARCELEDGKRYYEDVDVDRASQLPVVLRPQIDPSSELHDSFYDIESDRLFDSTPTQCEDSFYDPSTDNIFFR
uniref:DNA-directed primase/polymerase protein n=1 Tax=Steinernema glaseri TaxID=37863 RepID=A0A1I7XXY9_9BILA